MTARTSTRTRVLGVAFYASVAVALVVALIVGKWQITLISWVLLAAYWWSQWEDAR